MLEFFMFFYCAPLIFLIMVCWFSDCLDEIEIVILMPVVNILVSIIIFGLIIMRILFVFVIGVPKQLVKMLRGKV